MNPVDFKKQQALTRDQTSRTLVQEKISEALEAACLEGRQEALREHRAREKALKKFQGEVMAHAIGHSLLRFKASASGGQCWGCGERPFHNESPFRRCLQCDRSS